MIAKYFIKNWSIYAWYFTIIIGLIMCTISNNHVFGNVVFIEEDITNVLIASKDIDSQQNSFNDTIRDTHLLSEPYDSHIQFFIL